MVNRIFYYSLKLFEIGLYIAIWIYSCYILCTPGYYDYFIFYNFIVLVCLLLFKIIIPKRKNRVVKYKRVYGVKYLILMLVLNIITSTGLLYIIIEQNDDEINDSYYEALDSMSEFMDIDMNTDIFKKAVLVTPDRVKEMTIQVSTTIDIMLELSEYLCDAKESGNISEEVLESYKSTLSNVTDEYSGKENSVYLILYVIILTIIIYTWKFSFKELKNISYYNMCVSNKEITNV